MQNKELFNIFFFPKSKLISKFISSVRVSPSAFCFRSDSKSKQKTTWRWDWNGPCVRSKDGDGAEIAGGKAAFVSCYGSEQAGRVMGPLKYLHFFLVLAREIFLVQRMDWIQSISPLLSRQVSKLWHYGRKKTKIKNITCLFGGMQ